MASSVLPCCRSLRGSAKADSGDVDSPACNLPAEGAGFAVLSWAQADPQTSRTSRDALTASIRIHLGMLLITIRAQSFPTAARLELFLVLSDFLPAIKKGSPKTPLQRCTS